MTDRGATFDEVLDRRPDLAGPYRDFIGVFWARRLIDPVVLELCRLRVAQLLGCESELAVRTRPAVEAGLTDKHVSRLSEWPTAECFTDGQRAALGYSEQFVLDPHGVDDAMRADLHEHFSSAEVVALTEALALFDGFTRFQRLLCGEAHSDAQAGIVDPPAPGSPLELPTDADPAITASPLGEQPETLAAFLRLYGTLWSHGTVPQPLKEIARIRNARITDCGY
ncbi:MAG: carboxymuconolactone decarboxylase family protein [Acidimicrobiia bacterium]